jgi:head-tail adaptor
LPILEAGKLRHRVNIMALSLARDSFGGYQINQSTVFASHVPASIETLSGRELLSAQTKVSQVTHRIRLRWMPGIVPQQNIQWPTSGGAEYDQFFQIQAVENPDGIRHMLMLLCIERVASQLGT